MAWANEIVYPWENTMRPRSDLSKMIHEFVELNTNKPHFKKRYINGSRFVLYWGNSKKLNVVCDWNLGGTYDAKLKKQVPCTGIDAQINIKDMVMTVYHPNILEQGSNVFGNGFHKYVQIHYHYGTGSIFEGTKHEIEGKGSWHEVVTPDKKNQPFFSGMKLDLNTFAILNKAPKEAIERAETWKEITRLRINGRARARNRNLRAQERLQKYQNTSDINQLEMEDAFRLFNVSERRIVIEAFGMDTILANCESKVLDKHEVDGRPYEVVQVMVEDTTSPDGVRGCNYLRMVNPSTSEIHFEGIPNNQTKVSGALQWRDNDENGYVKPIVLT